jgi:formate dehydrogenase formation protein
VPYRPIAHPPQAQVLASAERRWRALVEAKPELEAAVALQRGLLTRVIDLARTIDGGRLPRLSLPGKYLAAKLSHGVPVLSGEPIPLPNSLLKSCLVGFCEDLAAGGAGEAASHIGTAIDSGRLDAGSLLTASLARDEEAVRTGATHLALAPDLTWLVAELAVGPVAHALQRTLLAVLSPGSPRSQGSPGSSGPQPPAAGGPGEAGGAVGPLAEALSAWNHGYCPACGSWPALAEVVQGHRLLRCSFCAATWERTIYACVYCDEAGEAFVTAAPDALHDDRRIEVCSGCGAYLKTVDTAEPSPFPLVAIADMETMDLDVAAMDHHFGRPPLRKFAARGIRL